MKIICCGDSFFSIDKQCPNTHLSELLATKLGASLENYAKLGASNFTIALQLEYAIKQNPDLIIMGFTSVDRIDIPFDQYRIPDGILNIKYDTKNKLPSFYNEQLTTVLSNSFPNLKQTDAVKLYISELYDPELKRQHDFFIASGLLRKLDKLNIKYVFTRGGLQGLDWEEWSDHEVNYETACPWLHVAPPGTEESGSSTYHTTFSKQKELADKWMTKVNELYNLV